MLPSTPVHTKYPETMVAVLASYPDFLFFKSKHLFTVIISLTNPLESVIHVSF